MKYDLKDMEFDPDKTVVVGLFIWSRTPEGFDYWEEYDANNHQRGRDKIAAMIKQWKEEQAMTTLPAINVLHKHDGSDKGPLPEGANATTWTLHEDVVMGIEPNGADWSDITAYLVHNYPEIKEVTGTVTYTNGMPDFKTWEAN